MSEGAIITMSGEAHKGFHQCPNFIRDKYLPLIKSDGYGYINYILSWANSGQALSQRRIMKDLGCSQGKLVAIQERVLKHCGHFISKIDGSAAAPGKLGVSNRWHIDAEMMWGENAMHLAAQAQKRLEARTAQSLGESVSKTDTLPSDRLEGVSKTDTLAYPKPIRSVSETDTYKRKRNTSPKKEEAPAPQAGKSATPPNASSSSEEASPDELLDALLDESEGGQVEGLSSQPTSDAPSRTPDLSEMTTGKGGQQEDQPTAVEKVPAAGGAAAAPANEVAAVNAQLDRYLNRRWLAPYQLGDTVMPPLSTEIVDGLDRAEIPQMVSLEQLRELHNQTRRNISQRKREQATNPGLPGLNYTTELLRMLHEHVEQRLVVREMAQEYQADLRAEAAAAAPQGESAGDLRISGHSEWQVGDQVIYMREPHEIVRITRLKITVALLSDRDIEHDIIRSSMVQNTLRPYRPQQRTG